MFKDRADAGRRLADILKDYSGGNCTIYALPRGGVPVAFEVSRKLNIPLDVLIVKKVGAPYQEELALGAVTEGEPPTLFFNDELIRYMGLNEELIQPAVRKKIQEIEDIRHYYRNGDNISLSPGDTALIIDDGVATGATVKAAVKFFREHGYSRVVVAVPVAHTVVLNEIRSMVDDVRCVNPVEHMYAVGEFYADFSEVTHEKAREMVQYARARLQRN